MNPRPEWVVTDAAQLQKVVMASGKERYLYDPPALRTPRGEADPTSTGG